MKFVNCTQCLMMGCLALFTMSQLGCLANRVSASRSVERVLEPDSSIAGVEIVAKNGSAKIIGHGGAEVSVKFIIRSSGNSYEEANLNCDLVDVAIATTEDDFLRFEPQVPPEVRSYSVNFELHVPESYLARVKSTNGSITIEELMNSAEAETTNGRVRMQMIAGNVRAETSNGSIDLDDIGGKIAVRSSNGSVDVDSRLAVMQHTIRTSNGRITVSVPEDQLASIVANTSNGKIRCSLPEQAISKETKKSFKCLVGAANVDEGVIAEVNLRSSNGSISVSPSKKKAVSELVSGDAEFDSEELGGAIAL